MCHICSCLQVFSKHIIFQLTWMFSYCLCIVVTADVKEKPKKNPYLQTKVKVFIKSW